MGKGRRKRFLRLGINHHVSNVNVHQLDRGGERSNRNNVFSGRHPEQ